VFGIVRFEQVTRVDRRDRAADWRGSGLGVDRVEKTCHGRIPAKAADDLGEFIRLQSQDGWARYLQILLLSAAGERDGLRRAITGLLDRFRDRPTDADSAKFWDELESRLLRNEAEVLILL
jgi:hypothetical protein